ncbi:MAG: hypothetical protein ACKORL_05380, partial [Phycisphaerales bacterium]
PRGVAGGDAIRTAAAEAAGDFELLAVGPDRAGDGESRTYGLSLASADDAERLRRAVRAVPEVSAVEVRRA